MPFSSASDELDIRLAGARQPEDSSEGSLAVDVFRDEGDIVIQSTIAGATPADIDISILNDMVTIKGSRKSEFKATDSMYEYQEIYWGPFSRTIILPEQVDPDNAKASMNIGILTIRLPTLEKARTKKLKIELK